MTNKPKKRKAVKAWAYVVKGVIQPCLNNGVNPLCIHKEKQEDLEMIPVTITFGHRKRGGR